MVTIFSALEKSVVVDNLRVDVIGTSKYASARLNGDITLNACVGFRHSSG